MQEQNSVKQGDALSPLLFNFSVQYVFRGGSVYEDDLKLNGIYQLLVYDDVNILSLSVHTIKIQDLVSEEY
jgi:hypothetical protein